jgi:very-short-patch-repair endonuclease
VKRARARELRRDMTPAETALWQHLRASRLNGLHFRRQQIVHGFIADFYCHAAGVVVEVDGGVHATQADYDQTRDAAFAALGLFVLRVRNEDVLGATADVLVRIARVCAKRQLG